MASKGLIASRTIKADGIQYEIDLCLNSFTSKDDCSVDLKVNLSKVDFFGKKQVVKKYHHSKAIYRVIRSFLQKLPLLSDYIEDQEFTAYSESFIDSYFSAATDTIDLLSNGVEFVEKDFSFQFGSIFKSKLNN
ncbi:MAG: hypothetical protein ACRCXZ_06880 [Patescibacteria group bacterium]